jgi:hypothetical protein
MRICLSGTFTGSQRKLKPAGTLCNRQIADRSSVTKGVFMRNLIFALALVAVPLGLTQGQQSGSSWMQLTAKDAEKILNHSAWGQTQAETNTAEMFFTPTSQTNIIATTSTSRNARAAGGPTLSSDNRDNNQSRASEGAYNQAVNVNYRIRFFSAKPVREALARSIVLQREPSERELIIPQMQSLVDRNFEPWIVVIVNFDGEDGRLLGKTMQDFASATADGLKIKTYLERSDGKRIFLLDYRAPGSDGLGAKFVFSRLIDGQPFLTESSGTVRFVSEVGANVKLNRPFKVKDMMYHGKLEY